MTTAPTGHSSPELVDIKTAPEAEAETGGCCGSAQAELDTAPATSSCCGDQTEAAPAATSCCGDQTEAAPTASITPAAADAATVQTGMTLQTAVKGLEGVLHVTAGIWPYLLPSWLQATQDSLAEAKPWHSVAYGEDGDAAFLPGFVFNAPSTVDADPRTYLGWQPASGESACCSVESCCDATTDVEALGEDQFFPALLLGSPLGYRSEAVSSTDDPLLLADLVDQVVPAAQAAGIRSIVAPWVSDLPHNEVLLIALKAHGGTISFWGEENVLTLEHDSYDAHMASLRSRRRQRIKADHAKALASGVDVVRKDGADLLPLVDRIAELTGLNRQKYDGSEGPEHIKALLSSLIASGTDVRAYLGYRQDRIVASTVAIRQGRRLFVKWAGFDYEALGERSGLYFELTFDRPLRDAYEEKLQALESGPGADEAKRLRGCRPRAVHSVLLMTDPNVRAKATALQNAFGEARREALGAETAEETVSGRLLARFRSSGKEGEPVKPAQSEGSCCG